MRVNFLCCMQNPWILFQLKYKAHIKSFLFPKTRQSYCFCVLNSLLPATNAWGLMSFNLLARGTPHIRLNDKLSCCLSVLKEACSIITQLPGKYILKFKQALILHYHLAYLKYQSKTTWTIWNPTCLPEFSAGADPL